ncbi:Dbl-like domain-containing protein [Boletus reticuloceps]|uniref:Dbl-like domain-containing protein n=1 Tax=Boletus reticuloceps TaxID=495285 RepID=A0A8I2YQ95_9AGAM|nr:Dbl-like domain-containing protein [Boletus reticuloceps]
MKAFLNRLNRGLSKEPKGKDKDKDKVDKEKDKDSLIARDPSDTNTLSSTTNSNPHSPAREKKELLQLPPLPEWPPSSRTENRRSHVPSFAPPQIQRSVSAGTTGTNAGTPSSIASTKPLPDLSARPLPPIEEPNDADADSGVGLPVSSPVPHTADPSEPPSKSAARKAAETAANSEIQKKVAFNISPPPTPSGPSTSHPLPEASTSPTISGSPSQAPAAVPLKTTVSRFQATHVKDTRGSTPIAASSSRTDLGSKQTTTNTPTTALPSLTPTSVQTSKATSTRTAISPYPGSIRSGTPYSQMSNTSTRILAVTSWSESAEEDLVSNLGPRERTRQEVLWEIVASEERYVNDLQKMKETFIEPLLHPYALPPTSPLPYDYDEYASPPARVDSPHGSTDVLPIAARFMSPTGFRSDGTSGITPETKSLAPTTPNIDDESAESDVEDHLPGLQSNRPNVSEKHSHPRSPYRMGSALGGKSVQRMNQVNASSQSLGRQSGPERERERDKDRERKDSAKTTPTLHSRLLRKPKRSQTQPDASLQTVPPHLLPEDLRVCLEVIESGVLDGHVKLSEGLRKRYEEQYPLVRSLADVFVSNSHIFQGYATYVLHLERALEQVDNALSTASPAKKPKNQDSAEWLKVCKTLQRLEESSADKGETGLAITLSKPFQRLLKYPLLFQNLLFHTDPSTFEYESTLQMVAEVESIVRSIEDEKIQKEDRDKTRDVFARIEGLDKVKQLAIPKPSRLLLEERQVILGRDGSSSPKGSSPPSVMATKNVKGKTSFRRLSDVLGTGTGVGGKKDLWLVVFNDVVLRCQRTGTTSLPLVSSTNSRTNSLPEMQGKSKYATSGRRSSHTKPRNLYKFIKIETWAIGDVVQPKEGVVAMEDVVRSKVEAHSAHKPRIIPLPDDDEDGDDSDDSDKKSKMSFSYWGADKVTLQKPVLKPKQHSVGGSTRRVSPGGTSYARESSANAKFGTRLMSGDQASPAMRPANRKASTVPSTKTRVNPSDDSHSVKATVTRPAWDTSTRGNLPAKRPRQTSQTSAATRATVTATTTNNNNANNKPQLSPVVSEGSGVELYRQLVAQDPSLAQ